MVERLFLSLSNACVEVVSSGYGAQPQVGTYHCYNIVASSYGESDIWMSGIESLLKDGNKGRGIVHKVLKRLLQNKEQVHDAWQKSLGPGALTDKLFSTESVDAGSLHNEHWLVLRH